MYVVEIAYVVDARSWSDVEAADTASGRELQVSLIHEMWPSFILQDEVGIHGTHG